MTSRCIWRPSASTPAWASRSSPAISVALLEPPPVPPNVRTKPGEKAMHQPQRLIQRTASDVRDGLVEIVPAHGHHAKERLNVLGPMGMAFFPRAGWCCPARSGRTGCIIFRAGSAHRLKRASRRPNSTASMLATPWLAKLRRTRLRKAVVSWKSVRGRLPAAGVFFTVLGLVLQAGDLVAQRHKLLGQRLEGPVIFDVVPHLRGTVRTECARGTSCRERTPAERNKGCRGRRYRSAGGEELLAKGTAPKPVNGLHLEEGGLPLMHKIIKIGFHARSVSI